MHSNWQKQVLKVNSYGPQVSGKVLQQNCNMRQAYVENYEMKA